MRRFVLERDDDPTGISGTGTVAEGIEFADGTVAARWRSPSPSTCIWSTIGDVIAVHGHNGRTRLVWLDT